MIKTVTITGADDSVKPSDLLELSKEFPFVEWGILVSKNNYGTARYPSLNWLQSLFKQYFTWDLKPALSCHLCGRYVRNLFNEVVEANQLPAGYHPDVFNRVQINFHAIPHGQSSLLIRNLAQYGLLKEYIFQYDGVNDGIARTVQEAGFTASVLFDKSGGAGILPGSWPKYLDGLKCGYAGGLSPDNVQEQIKLILEAAGNNDTWIDVETHVRSNQDQLFDLEKVRKFLYLSSQSVKL